MINKPEHDAAPFNPLPPVVAALAVVVFGIECLFLAGESGLITGKSGLVWRSQAIADFAFPGPALAYMIETKSAPPELLIRFVSYAFVHASFTQAAFVCVFILALGKFVGEVFRPWALIGLYIGAAIGGAIAFSLVPGNATPLIGGFPATYGLIGAYTWLLWMMAGKIGQSRLAAFRLIGFLMGLQLILGAFFGGDLTWVADLGGFVTGFALSFVVSPGGPARLREKLRR